MLHLTKETSKQRLAQLPPIKENETSIKEEEKEQEEPLRRRGRGRGSNQHDLEGVDVEKLDLRITNPHVDEWR